MGVELKFRTPDQESQKDEKSIVWGIILLMTVFMFGLFVIVEDKDQVTRTYNQSEYSLNADDVTKGLPEMKTL